MVAFGERLRIARERHGPVCVGIDPHPQLLDQWGLPRDVRGVDSFARRCVSAFAGRVALVKPQVAFFECHGSAGMTVLEWLIGALRDAGTLVLADAKRGDIGSTMAAYAQAWLSDGPLGADALTLSPYLGFEALRPALEVARQRDRGVFVLAATSNQEARDLQRARTAAGTEIAQTVVDAAAAENRQGAGLGSVGVVVGATLSRIPDLSQLEGPVLLPGVGAQGASAAGMGRLLRSEEFGLAFPSVSRDVLAAGPEVSALRARLSFWQDEFAFLLAAV